MLGYNFILKTYGIFKIKNIVGLQVYVHSNLNDENRCYLTMVYQQVTEHVKRLT